MAYEKKLFIGTITVTVLSLLALGGLNIYVDPYVHFHNVNPKISYGFSEDSARYENDGILRHYDYDAIITGTSMTQNFLASEFDELFHVNSVKVSLSGASYKEVDEQCRRAIQYNKNIKYILRGLDFGYIMEEKDLLRYDDYPEYLYNGIGFDDVNYVLDKKTTRMSLYDVVRTIMNKPGTTMDDYQYWGSNDGYAKIEYEFDPEKHTQEKMTEEERRQVEANISQNITAIADENPDITFLYFITPYSICSFDEYEASGELDKRIEAEHMLIRECMKYSNIEIYSFLDCEDMICDLANYAHMTHYIPEINSLILQSMKSGEHRITEANYNEYCMREQKLLKEWA